MRQLGLELDLASTATAGRAGQVRSFHLRSHATIQEARKGERRAATQDLAVLDWMRVHPGRWTPWDCAEAMGLCITSARRAMTNLSRRGLLRHVPGERRPAGPWGQRSGVWEACP